MGAGAEARVLDLRRIHRSWGARRIVFGLERAGVVPVPSESGAYRALVRAALIEPGGRRRRAEHRADHTGRPPAAQGGMAATGAGKPMELWQVDVVGGFLLAAGTHALELAGPVTGRNQHACDKAPSAERAWCYR